jgi:hypothetical protein
MAQAQIRYFAEVTHVDPSGAVHANRLDGHGSIYINQQEAARIGVRLEPHDRLELFIVYYGDRMIGVDVDLMTHGAERHRPERAPRTLPATSAAR